MANKAIYNKYEIVCNIKSTKSMKYTQILKLIYKYDYKMQIRHITDVVISKLRKINRFVKLNFVNLKIYIKFANE